MGKEYLYDTHIHTLPVSKCSRSTVRQTLEFYVRRGFDGVFITNHFLDGNIDIDKSEPYEKQLDFYFSDFDEAVRLGAESGIRIFLGEELSYGGTDFLVYGLEREFFYAHPEIMKMPKREELAFLRENGAFVVHAHPFREAQYIDHLRLFPRSVDAVEVINACRTEFENHMAEIYAKEYGFPRTAGTDKHAVAEKQKYLGAVSVKYPLTCVEDYVAAVKNGDAVPVLLENPEYAENK